MKSDTRETQKHGFGIDLAPELALVMLFLLKSPTSTQIQAKGNAGNVSHGETLGKLVRKGMNLPKTGPAGARLVTTVCPTSASSGHPCDPDPLLDPWILLGIVIAEPLWHFPYGAELNVLCDFKAFPGNLVFLCSHHFQRKWG